MKKIAILGSGQLGIHLHNEFLKNHFKDSYTCIFSHDNGFDITNYEFLHVIFKNYDIIINCAALTNVDLCENDLNLSYNINAKAVYNMGDLALKYDKTLIHISTDYVYGSNNIDDGNLSETSKCNPINIYGKHKFFADENLLFKNLSNLLILRPSWLFGKTNPKNFIEKINNNLSNNSEIKVVDDQFGIPTSVNLIYKVINQFLFENNIPSGLYNIRNESDVILSRFDIANKIKTLNNSNCNILKCKTFEFSLPAKRQLNSMLDISKIKKYLTFRILSFEEELDRYFRI